MLERSPAGLLVTTLDGDILQANEAAARTLGFGGPDEFRGTSMRDRYRSPDERDALIGQLRETGSVENAELAMETRDGEPVWILTSITVDRVDGHDAPVLIGSWIDVTRRHDLRDALAHRARHDDLTATLNRDALYESAEQALAMCRRQGRKAAAVYVDLVGFKQVNEQLGHRGGDQVLRTVAERLDGASRDSNLVARMGGDEFVVLTTMHDEAEDAVRAARRLLYAFDDPIEVEAGTIQVQPAMGLAVFPDDAEEVDSLLERADRALWGRDRDKGPGLRRYRSESRTSADETDALRRDLKRSLQCGPDFVLRYQPIVDARSDAPVGFEALVRWEHPERGTVSPGAFIPVAEASGLIREVDRHVFRTALRQAETWNRHGVDFGWISVNLSTQTLCDPEFVDFVRRTLDRHPRVDPRQVVLEVTEHASLKDVHRTEVLERLSEEVGLSISIDDFGLGYSSLLYLRDFPADRLKIDMEFVQGVADSECDQKMVRGIIGLGRAFDMTLVAEGVETEAQAKWLREHGCPRLQGYLFGKPMSAGEVAGAFGGRGGTRPTRVSAEAS